MKFLISAFFILVGVLAMISGEADDSPGLQGLGMILIIAVLYFQFRRRKPK
jgi:hypothetical protein